MRKNHDRYGPDWFSWLASAEENEIIEIIGYNPHGCVNCQYGIVSEPDTSRIPAPLYLKRCIAAAHGSIIFCKCEAGRHAEAYIGKKMMEISAHFLTPNSRLIVLQERSDGLPKWINGRAPHGYISSNLVKTVIDAIEKPPPIHGASESPVDANEGHRQEFSREAVSYIEKSLPVDSEPISEEDEDIF